MSLELDASTVRSCFTGRIQCTRCDGHADAAFAALLLSFITVLIVGSTLSTGFGLLARRRANDLESMLYDMQAPYQADAAAQLERKKLLVSVLAELEKIPTDRINAERIKRCRATATLGLADVENQLGDSKGLAGASASMKNYETAIRWFEELREAAPDDPRYQVRLLSSHNDQQRRPAFGSVTAVKW